MCAWEYGIRVGWMRKKYKSMMGEGGVWQGRGVEGDRGGGVCCLLEVAEGCSCQVNVLQCTLKGIETVVGKCIRWKSVPLGYCPGKEAAFVVVVGGGYLYVFVWVVGSCLAVSGHWVLVEIDV